ncbi:hypothetical protein QFZ75_007961 [Streptomyces sp. V3I8]|uniref:hypothetical protein n=1 Tax=Streptomyces sp. V3I8 TaxID=3042279 RepID=UPI00277E3885|nr:hypothetical protein [Streptomyces sp. V3I8]MDQ1041459.1 hypothetical protein [Streptomyces sp. V3I8]
MPEREWPEHFIESPVPIPDPGYVDRLTRKIGAPSSLSEYRQQEKLRQRSGDQPLPTEGQENVQDRLIELLSERRTLGIERYGRALQTFNGRNAIRDLIEELLDGATYAMQAEMERDATRRTISAALDEHRAGPDGLCASCHVAIPCRTRKVLTRHPGLAAEQEKELGVKTTHPVEEVAVHPDSLEDFKSRFRVQEAERRLGGALVPGELFGFPVVLDDTLPLGTVRLRPRGFDNHPSHGTKEQTP